MKYEYAISILRDKKRAHNYSMKEWRRMKTCYDNLERNKFYQENKARVIDLQQAIKLLQESGNK